MFDAKDKAVHLNQQVNNDTIIRTYVSQQITIEAITYQLAEKSLMIFPTFNVARCRENQNTDPNCKITPKTQMEF